MELQGSFFQYGIEFFRSYFLREVNCQELQEGPLLPEVGAQQVPNHTVQVLLGSGCEDTVPCIGAQGMGLTPACHSRALQCSLCAHWAWGKDHPSPVGSLLSLPSLDPNRDGILGLLAGKSRDPSKPCLPGWTAHFWANPQRESLWKCHQWKQ